MINCGRLSASPDLLPSRFHVRSICRPSGTPNALRRQPSAEALGYDLPSLRDGMDATSIGDGLRCLLYSTSRMGGGSRGPRVRDHITRTLGALLIVFALCGTSFAAPGGSPAARKQQARTQFETAERMREALNGRPEIERTRKGYQKVADAYRKVYYVSPASPKADASVMAVAEILAEMGRQFAPDAKDLQASIGEYEFLRREYPGSKYRVEALFTIGQIYKQDLSDEAAAKATFEEFLKKYPHNPLSAKA